MPSPLPLALLALALTDSLPSPLYSVDGPQVAYTVAQYADTTVTAWRLGPGVVVEAVIESPGEGEVLVLLVPRAGEDQSTGVNELPPASSATGEAGRPATPSSSGLCGRLFSIEWR